MQTGINHILTDSFGREHNYLRISLTEKCNLRCVYCMPEEGVALTPREHLMTAQEIEKIASVFTKLGVNKIRLTGGEPLVRKDAADIIERLSCLPVSMAITTNAILLDRYVDVFKKAGLRSINVSLDTLKEERFQQITKRSYFKKTLDNIDLMIAQGFHLKVNVVLMRGMNDDELLDFINWTADKNVHVRFIEFMPFDGNRWQWDKIVSYREILERVQEKFAITKLRDKKNDTTKAYQVNGFKGTFAVISSMTDHFCGSCNRLRLTANGKLKNCLFSNNETDLLTPFRAGENIELLIEKSIAAKKAKHGGIKALERLTADDPQMSERSMILIGG